MPMISRDESKNSGRLLMVGHHTQLQDGLGFQLSHPFPRNIDLTADFGKCQWFGSIKSEA